MRKRFLIATIAAVTTMSAGTFCLSKYREQRENSIEYHKAEYLAARDGRPLMNKMRFLWGKLTGRPVQLPRLWGKRGIHEGALLRLGYFHEQTILVSNVPAPTVLTIAHKKAANLRQLTQEICVLIPTWTNTILIRAVPDHIPIWERLIREADVPASPPMAGR